MPVPRILTLSRQKNKTFCERTSTNILKSSHLTSAYILEHKSFNFFVFKDLRSGNLTPCLQMSAKKYKHLTFVERLTRIQTFADIQSPIHRFCSLTNHNVSISRLFINLFCIQTTFLIRITLHRRHLCNGCSMLTNKKQRQLKMRKGTETYLTMTIFSQSVST